MVTLDLSSDGTDELVALFPGYSPCTYDPTNGWQPINSVDPKNRNTYGIGPNGDDEEFLCWMAETTWKIGSADMEDWAKPGKKWK